MKDLHPIELFIFLILLLMFALVSSQIIEPETKLECTNAKVVDAYRTDNDNILVVDADAFVEKLNVNDKDFYHHSIGKAITICFYRKTYTHLPVGWEIER